MSAVAGPSRGGGGRGGRGRGRGRGGSRGGGGGGGGAHALPMGALTWTDIAEMDKAKPNRHAYPPLEEKPVLREPSESEMRVIRNQLRFVQAQRDTPWWPRQGDDVASAATAAAAAKGTQASASTAVAGIKRSSAYLPRYSDKFRRTAGTDDVHGGTGSVSSLSLQGDKTLLNMLQREAFPTGLWRMYVEGESRRQERREEAASSRRRHGDWKRIVEGVEVRMTKVKQFMTDKDGLTRSIHFVQLAGNDAGSDALPSDDEGEDGDQDEYEDDVEDDYADNYFDNGEDDDLADEGGAGEAEDVYE